MAYFYVKSGGTATGDGGRYASAKTATDTWAVAFSAATEYYSDIISALGATTAPTSGDFILVSSASAYAATGVATYSIPAGVSVISVDDSNVGQALAGASEERTAAGDDVTINLGLDSYVFGVTFKTGDDMRFNNGAGSGGKTEFCTLDGGSGGSALNHFMYSASMAHHIGLTFKTNGDQMFIASQGSTVLLEGGEIDAGSAALFRDVFEGEGGYAELVGTKLSNVVTAIVNTVSTGFGMMRFRQCEMPSAVTKVSPTGLDIGRRFEFYQCGNSSAAEYQFYIRDGDNEAEDATNIYRDGSTAFDGGQKVSIKVDTDAGRSRYAPFHFELPATWAALSAAATDTIRLHMLSSATLTDQDIWAQLIYPDGVNIFQANIIKTQPADILSAGTTLTTNTEAWTGRTTENRYQIDLDTSGDPGADSAPIIKIFVGKPSATIYIDTSVEVVA